MLRGAGTVLSLTKVDQLTPAPFTVRCPVVDDLTPAETNLTTAAVPTGRLAGMDRDDLGVWTSRAGTRWRGCRIRTATCSR